MKFSTSVLPFATILVASVASIPIRRAVDPALVPPFGHASGINPTGTGKLNSTTPKRTHIQQFLICIPIP
jgi:hypothetical protein